MLLYVHWNFDVNFQYRQVNSKSQLTQISHYKKLIKTITGYYLLLSIIIIKLAFGMLKCSVMAVCRNNFLKWVKTNFLLFYSAKMSLVNLGKKFKKSLAHQEDLLTIGDPSSVNEKTKQISKKNFAFAFTRCEWTWSEVCEATRTERATISWFYFLILFSYFFFKLRITIWNN